MGVSLKEIAKLAGVSVATVSYVLNGKGSISDGTRERVKEAIRGLGYTHKLRSGLLIMLASHIAHMPEVHQAAAEFGYAVQTAACRDTLEEPPALTVTKRIAGVIVYGGLWKRSFLEALAVKYPTVLMGSTLPTVQCDSVWVDNAGGIYTAADMLIKMGHRRIGLLNGPGNSATSAEKELGFKRAIRHSGLAIAEKVVEAESFGRDHGRTATRRLFELDPALSAVIACESDLGRAAADICKEQGRNIPGDVSLIVFRDDPSFADPSSCGIPLTALRFPEHQIARETVNLMLRRIDNPNLPGQRVLIQPEMILRESVTAQ